MKKDATKTNGTCGRHGGRRRGGRRRGRGGDNVYSKDTSEITDASMATGDTTESEEDPSGIKPNSNQIDEVKAEEKNKVNLNANANVPNKNHSRRYGLFDDIPLGQYQSSKLMDVDDKQNGKEDGNFYNVNSAMSDIQQKTSKKRNPGSIAFFVPSKSDKIREMLRRNRLKLIAHGQEMDSEDSMYDSTYETKTEKKKETMDIFDENALYS